ncbi:alpha/beta hydrolase [Rothia aerolata]|uniref:Phospholipase n=1 Tax=Rothia aerolata TaxID=1812262 RepID=A0A917IVS7_9MICC|nr:dienelactone hydrolase family protein [Rothia aerolata]GGH63271.1 phospholipase [Rothia aerolata]
MTYTIEYSNRPEERPESHAVLLLHGYGSHERDLLGLVQYLPRRGVTYISMRAPQPVGALRDSDSATSAVIPGSAMGYQWWPLTGGRVPAETDTLGVELATDYVVDYLKEIKDTYASISLLGFSQGMAIASSVARRRPDLIHAVIGLSGFVVESDSDFYRNTELTEKKLPFFYGRGDSDPVIHTELVAFTDSWLPGTVDLDFHLYPGLAHSVSGEELNHVSDFIERRILAPAAS